MNEIGVIPLIRYQNVTQAVHWLINFFGFKACNLIKNSDGTVSYAELSYGRGMLMVGPVGQSRLDDILKQPQEINGVNTQCCYVALQDIKNHYRQACHAGVEIVLELKEHNNGEYSYVARDIEGHLWNFGTYNPWEKNIKPIIKKEQGRHPFYQPSNKYAGPVAISSLIAFLLYSSFTFINSYLSTIKSSQDYIMPTMNSEVEKKLSNTEGNSQNSKNEFVFALENNQDFTSKEKKVIEERFSSNQFLSFENVSIDKPSGQTDKSFERSPMEVSGIGSPSQELSTKGEERYTDTTSAQNFPTGKNSYLSFPYIRDPATSSSPELTPMTGSIGEQPSEDPTVSSEEPLPPVTVPRSVPSMEKPTKIKQSVDIKKIKGKSFPTKMTPASTKKRNYPSTEKTLFYLFN